MKATVSRALKTSLRMAAVAAFAAAAGTAAHAQSSAQLYGQVDTWAGMQQFPGGQRAYVLGGGGMSTSYWGLKGSEDLGGGYKAVFTLEDFFLPQNGNYGRFTGDSFFSRNAYVGIESPYGTVTAGRLTTNLFVSTILFNPFIDSYTFSPMVYHVFLGNTAIPTGATYGTDTGVVGDSGWNNAVQYSTPDYNGLSANVMYGLGNQAGSNGSKKWSAQFLYFHGPFAATGVYQYVNFNNAPGDLVNVPPFGSIVPFKSQGVAQLGASYDMKFVKFYGQYMYTKNDTIAGSSWHVNTGQGGVTVPVGPGKVMASFAYSRDSGGLDQTRRTWALGYDYPLSKRTDLYAAYMNDHLSNLSTGQTIGAGIRAKF
ncbi:MAG: porin [Trinickia sp.]|jgi:predicted porin